MTEGIKGPPYISREVGGRLGGREDQTHLLINLDHHITKSDKPFPPTACPMYQKHLLIRDIILFTITLN